MNISNRIKSIERRAFKKQIEFNLTEKWFMEQLNNGRCGLTGIKFKLYPIMNPYYPVIDRIDNEKGYTIDNCMLIVNLINCAKGEYNLEILYEWATKFVNKYEKVNQHE